MCLFHMLLLKRHQQEPVNPTYSLRMVHLTVLGDIRKTPQPMVTVNIQLS